MSELKLTPLGEKLVSQDKSWMPSHEWADALQSPQTLYDFGSLSEGNAYMRLKYYEKGWIDDNRWLDVLVDHLADTSLTTYPQYGLLFHYSTLVYLNPSQDYSGNSTGDFLFWLAWAGVEEKDLKPVVSYWKGPFTSGYWKIPSKSLVIGDSSIGISPDFPQSGSHLIYEMRINLDKLGQYPFQTIPAIPFGDSFGFAVWGSSRRAWPRELAQNGLRRSAYGTWNIPSYSGTGQFDAQAVIQVTTVTTTATTIQQQSTTIVNTTTTTAEPQITSQSSPIILASVSGIVGLVIGLLVSRLRRKRTG
jgi:hypothetical protein